MRHCFKAVLIIFAVAAASGCAQLDFSTAWSLRNLDLLTLDPRTTRLALALPPGAQIREVTMSMQFRRQQTLLIDETIELEIITSGPELDEVGFPANLPNRLVLRVPASRVDAVLNYQRSLLLERENGSGASATFGLGTRMDPEWLEQHCVTGKGPITISAWLLVNEAQGYLPLFEDSQLGRLLNTQARNICNAQES